MPSNAPLQPPGASTEPENPAEAAAQLAAWAWHDAKRKADEYRDELAEIVRAHREQVGLTRLRELTGLSRTTLLRMADESYAIRQTRR